MSLNTKFISLLVLGLLLLLLMVYLVSVPDRPPGMEKSLKLIHKGHHNSGSFNKTLPTNPPDDGSVLAEHVERACKELKMGRQQGASIQPDRFDHILVDDRYKMLYCYIPKVACTNWRRVLLVLSGKVKARNVLDIPGGDVHGRYKRLLPRLSNFSQHEIQRRLDRYYKFMFVREPFERLLSAWRNKFQGGSNTYFKKQFGQNIMRRFRDSSEDDEEGTSAAVIGGKSGGGVRLEEFLQYIVDPLRTEALNEHWATYHRLCLPCSVRYDFVGKYETLDADAQHVLRAVHADRVVRFPQRSASYKHNQTSSFLASFYGNISAPLMRRVHKVYKKDFQFFDYALPSELQWMFKGVPAGDDRN